MGRLFGAAAIAAGFAVGFAGAPAGAGEGPGLTAAGVSARAFGVALARQFAADHARASYGQDGLFANGVWISLPGAAGRRAVGQRAVRPEVAARRAGGRHFPMGTLTVAGTNLTGRPDTGDVVLVFNADDSSRFADPIETQNFFDHGVTKFSVPSGHYWAIGLFISFGGTVTGHGGSYTATFTAPAGAKVSLRTSASDAAGGSISETITNAYQTSS